MYVTVEHINGHKYFEDIRYTSIHLTMPLIMITRIYDQKWKKNILKYLDYQHLCQDFIHDRHFFFSTFHIYVIYKHLWYLTQLWSHGSSNGILVKLSFSVI